MSSRLLGLRFPRPEWPYRTAPIDDRAARYQRSSPHTLRVVVDAIRALLHDRIQLAAGVLSTCRQATAAPRLAYISSSNVVYSRSNYRFNED